MSGHSKWSTIKRAKGAADAKRGQTFTKVANAIALAARSGGSGDPDSNPRLRTILEEARSVNMPKENIQRAIDRGLGNLPGQSIEEVLYEGFGPAKVAFVVEGVTDNRLRTNQYIKNIFERSGGAMGSPGSVTYMFDRKGEIKVVSKQSLPSGEGNGGGVEDEILELIDLGAEDVEDFDEDGIKKYLVYVEIPNLSGVSTKITQSGFAVESAEPVFKPNITVEITDADTAQKVLDFAGKLEENDDVQKVYANFDVSENLLEERQGSANEQ